MFLHQLETGAVSIAVNTVLGNAGRTGQAADHRISAAGFVQIHQSAQHFGRLQCDRAVSCVHASLLQIQLMHVGVAVTVTAHAGHGPGGGIGQIEVRAIQHHHVHAGQAHASLLPAIRRPAGGNDVTLVGLIAEVELRVLAIDVIRRSGIGVAERRAGIARAGGKAVCGGAHIALAGVVVGFRLFGGSFLLGGSIIVASGEEGQLAVGTDRGQELIGLVIRIRYHLRHCKAVCANGEACRLDHRVTGGFRQQLLGARGGRGVAGIVTIPGIVGSLQSRIVLVFSIVFFLRCIIGSLVRYVLRKRLSMRAFGLRVRRVRIIVIIDALCILRISRLLLFAQCIEFISGQIVIRLLGRSGFCNTQRRLHRFERRLFIIDVVHIHRRVIAVGVAGAIYICVRHRGLGAAVRGSLRGIAHPGDIDRIAVHLTGEVQIAGVIVVHDNIGSLAIRIHGIHQADILFRTGILNLRQHQHVGVHGIIDTIGIPADGIEQVVCIAHGQQLIVRAGAEALSQTEGVAGRGIAGDLEGLVREIGGIEGQSLDLIHDLVRVLRPENLLCGEGVGRNGDLDAGEAFILIVQSVSSYVRSLVEGIPRKFPAA